MSSRVCATGHIKDPVPLIEKRRGLSPSGLFHLSFIHQVIIITGLNKLYDCGLCSRPEDGLRCRLGVKLPLKLKIKKLDPSLSKILSPPPLFGVPLCVTLQIVMACWRISREWYRELAILLTAYFI